MPARSIAKAWNDLQQKIVACEACSRLRSYCRQIGIDKRRSFTEWDYWAQPVPNLGQPPAELLIVGLAPAAHGANRTGRMFTGDRSGEWLFRAMHRAGFANQPGGGSRDDGLELINCVITAVGHCAPPENKPTPDEIANCRPWLAATIDLVQPQVLLALGQIAWKAIVVEARSRGWYADPMPKFGHGAAVELTDGRWLLGSFHPSQQNTFTGKLTEEMLDAVFERARCLLSPFAPRKGTLSRSERRLT